MVGVEGIADWVGRDVVDRDGEKVGKLADVYYDTSDSQPVFVSVKSGTFGRSHSLAPLKGATLARDYVRLDAPKELVKDAPSEASGGRLTGIDAIAVLGHFGLPADPDLEGEDRVCFQTAGAAEETERKRAEVEAAQARDAGAASGAAGTVATDEGPAPDRDLAEDEDAASGAAEPDRLPSAGAHPSASGTGGAARSQAPDADGDPLARLEQLERRVAALEARLG